MWLHNFMHRKVSCNISLDFRHLFPVLPVVMESVKMRHMWEVTSGFVYISCKISTSKCSQFEKILPQFKIIQIQRRELKNIQVTSSGKFVLYLSFLFPLNGYGVSVRPVQMRKLLFLPVYCMYNHESPFSEYTESMTGQGLLAFFFSFLSGNDYVTQLYVNCVKFCLFPSECCQCFSLVFCSGSAAFSNRISSSIVNALKTNS